MDQRRLILFLVFSFALVMLWDGWLKHNQPPAPVAQQAAEGSALSPDGAVPTPTIGATAAQAVVPGEQPAAAASVPRTIVET
ncbi:MAG TPA: membrane protein insertase YidC, partial [Thauera sp.]|nr:membrane protein insertase YidC [Thauera sp.]